MRRLVVVGAGGFGRETLDVIEAINAASPEPVFGVVGVVDSGPSRANLARLEAREVPYLGTEADWLARRDDAEFVVGVGAPSARRDIVALFAGRPAASLVHPSAVLGSRVVIGDGVVICAGATVATEVVLRRHVHLNAGVTVGHDSVLEEFVSAFPGAVISGEVAVGTGAALGAASTVLPRLHIGSNAFVGAAACVVRDVPEGVTVKGVPAR